ncbi:FmdB family zinc ribbon protein [Mycobacterium sp. BMJ-28]
MPTYSYACTECDNRFDAVQAFSDDALTTCPKCSGRLRKLFGKVGVVFKGSGFYRNDSRDAAKSSSSSSSAAAPAKSESSSTSSSSDSSSTAAAGSSSSSASSSSGSSSSAPAAAASS